MLYIHVHMVCQCMHAHDICVYAVQVYGMMYVNMMCMCVMFVYIMYVYLHIPTGSG